MRIKLPLVAIVSVAAVIAASFFGSAHKSSLVYAADQKIIPTPASDSVEQAHSHTPSENQIDAAQAAEERRNAITRISPEMRSELAKMLNTSSKGLVETTKNGVTSVYLQGRFQTVPVATIDESGKAHVTDYSHMNPSQNQ